MRQENSYEEIKKRRTISLIIFIILLSVGIILFLHTIHLYSHCNISLAEKEILLLTTNTNYKEIKKEVDDLRIWINSLEARIYISALVILTGVASIICFLFIDIKYAINEKGEKLLKLESPLNAVMAGIFLLMYIFLVVYKNYFVIYVTKYLSLTIFIIYLTTIGIMDRKWTAFERNKSEIKDTINKEIK